VPPSGQVVPPLPELPPDPTANLIRVAAAGREEARVNKNWDHYAH